MHPSRTRSALLSALSLAALVIAGLALAAPATAANTDVRINEFSSNSPDFIELINTGPSVVDLSGWVLKDSAENNSYTFPTGSSIAAGAIRGISGESVEFVFGLGNGDAVRLYAPGGVLVDSFTYPAHPPTGTSYGRCPDGTGSLVITAAATKGAPNQCAPAGPPNVKINEVESNGDQVADWVELKNNGATPADISGWKILDNDPGHASTPVVVPANTTVAPGGYYAIYTEIGQSPGFGLGGADSATLLLPDGSTQIDTYSWTVHAATTYGRCPDGTGSFVTTTTSTRGSGNACSPVRINEIESDQGSPGDWVELKNISSSAVDLSGWVFKDNQDADVYTIPVGTTIAANGYRVLDVADFGFGLGGADSARLYDASSTLVESYSWTVHAPQTYGRCKDGAGDFVGTKAPTKGATNACPGLDTSLWPGSQSVAVADLAGTFVQDLSGLVFDPADPDVLWAAQNKKGTLFKLVRDASNTWVPADGWPKDPKYLGGTGAPDTEGLTIGPDGFVYLASERNNDASGVSRMSILRYDPAATGSTLTPTNEWNLTGQIPAAGANLGLEGVTYVPDSFLTSGGFVDQSTSAPYDPGSYPAHGNGVYFVAVEDSGDLIGFVLDDDGVTSHKVATIDSGFGHLADVDFDPELDRLRAVTDDTHDGRTSLLRLEGNGAFVVAEAFDRPAGMPNLNNEGLAVAPQSRCVAGKKEVLWSDDGDTDGHSLRRGSISCTAPAAQQVSFTSTPPGAPVVGGTYAVTATGGGSGNPVVVSVDPPSAPVCSLTGDLVRFDHPGTCVLNADQAAAQGFLAGSATQSLTVAKAPVVVTTRSTKGLLNLLRLRVTYTTTVTSAVTGVPVTGVPVTTRINGGSPTSGCTATTDAAGVASCTVGPVAIAVGVRYTATAAQTADFMAGTATAFIGLF